MVDLLSTANEEFIKYVDNLNLKNFEIKFIKSSFNSALNQANNLNQPFIIYIHTINELNCIKYRRSFVYLTKHLKSSTIQNIFTEKNWSIWPLNIIDNAVRLELFKKISDLTRYRFAVNPQSYYEDLFSPDPSISAAALILIQRSVQGYELKKIINIEKYGLDFKVGLISELTDFIDDYVELEKKLHSYSQANGEIMIQNSEKEIVQIQFKYQNDNPYVFKFKFKNQLLTYSFSPLANIKDLIGFIESKGLTSDKVKLVYSYPPENLLDYSLTTQLKDTDLSKKELIHIDEVN